MAEKKEKKRNRFEEIYHQGGGFTIEVTKILLDRETGVQYLYHESGTAGGLTPLLGKDGKAVVSLVESK